MKPEERASHSVSAAWGDGTSWVLQMNDQQDQSSSEANVEAEQQRGRNSSNEQEGVQMADQGGHGIRAKDVFAPQQAALWEELYDWCLKVRRDILALEVWAKQHGYRPDGMKDDPRRAVEIHIISLLEKVGSNDPGDPPGGPFE